MNRIKKDKVCKEKKAIMWWPILFWCECSICHREFRFERMWGLTDFYMPWSGNKISDYGSVGFVTYYTCLKCTKTREEASKYLRSKFIWKGPRRWERETGIKFK